MSNGSFLKGIWSLEFRHTSGLGKRSYPHFLKVYGQTGAGGIGNNTILTLWICSLKKIDLNEHVSPTSFRRRPESSGAAASIVLDLNENETSNLFISLRLRIFASLREMLEVS